MKRQLVPDSSIDGGNTQIPVDSKRVKQISARKHHFFTYNNYDSSIVPTMITLFNDICEKYAFQEETGESGTKHLQGVLTLKTKMRDTAFGLPKEIHWENPKDIEAAYTYCMKDETRTGQRWTRGVKLPYHFKLKTMRPWQQQVMDIIAQPPDDRSIHWFWEEHGNTGKSVLVKHLVVNNNAIFIAGGKQSDIINVIFNSNMHDSRIVCIDIPRNQANHISYSAIESIKNGLICNTKYETGFVAFDPPHIIVFANCPPNEDCLSADRWKITQIVGNHTNDAHP